MMTDEERVAGRIGSLLDAHADLIARGHADRAAALADRADDDPGNALLFAIAAALGKSLAPVPPDPGFRLHLRDLLECPEADLAVLNDRRPGLRAWPRAWRPRLASLSRRGSQLVPSPSAASRRTRRWVSSLAAASLVGVAAAWGIARVLRHCCVASRHGAPATGSAGSAPTG